MSFLNRIRFVFFRSSEIGFGEAQKKANASCPNANETESKVTSNNEHDLKSNDVPESSAKENDLPEILEKLVASAMELPYISSNKVCINNYFTFKL